VTDELPAGLTLAVGERRTVVLPGLGTAGYRWGVEVDRPEVAGVELGFAGDDSPSTRSTFSRDERATVRGLAPGETTVRFAQRRPWETQAPIAEHALQVTVVPANADDAA